MGAEFQEDPPHIPLGNVMFCRCLRDSNDSSIVHKPMPALVAPQSVIEIPDWQRLNLLETEVLIGQTRS